MSDLETQSDPEFAAIKTIYGALAPLDDDARTRVISYVVARFAVTLQRAPGGPRQGGATKEDGEPALKEEEGAAPKYANFAELYDAARPTTNADKALIAGYWLQVCQGAESFDGLSANRELKNLGEGLTNITNAIENLKSQSPALALQLKKSGSSQQARKTYKITIAGIKAVEVMING